MRRTNKRKNNNRKKRYTKKRRFSKKGGAPIRCEICGKTFNGPFEGQHDLDVHITTHPKCAYCIEDKRFKDNTELVKHIFREHRDKYNIADSMKDDTQLNNPSIIDKLQNSSITLPEFYTRIANKEKKILEKAKKAIPTTDVTPIVAASANDKDIAPIGGISKITAISSIASGVTQPYWSWATTKAAITADCF
jgi:hypothetical protein